MTVLHLKCQNRSIGLDLPTTPAEAAAKLSKLRKGTAASVRISGAHSPIPNLIPYIRHTDLENEADLQKLNTLAEKIDGMTQEEQRLFSGALELECTGELDDVLHIAERLERYEILPKITTDQELGRFLVDTSLITGKFSFPESVQPYLDYARIGAEQRETLGGVYTPHGLVRHREETATLAEAPMRLTLKISEQCYPLILPTSEERLEQTKRALGIDDFSQAAIDSVEYAAPDLNQLIPMDCITVEDANELAQYLQEMEQEEDALMKYCSVLSVEKPTTFSEAVSIAMDIDDYEQIPEDMDEYGKQVLRRAGADDEIIDTIDGYMDFARLGEDSLSEDGVRRTEFGLVRRLSEPFPPEQEIGQAMM